MPDVYEAADPKEPLNHGDILPDVPLVARRLDALEPTENRAVITSHGCDNEKYFRHKEKETGGHILQTYPVMVAPLYAASGVGDAGLQGDIEAGRVRRYFFLPADDGSEALVADLFYEQPVPAILLENLKPTHRLTREWWLRFLVHLWVQRSRLDPDDVFRKDVVPDAS